VYTKQDFIVGMVIVVAVGILLGTLIATSGWVEQRYDLYLRTASAEGLTGNSRVILQGLEVGRVRSISPRTDSVSRHVVFSARLSIRERFPDGSEMRLPKGTRAELVQVSQISTGVDVVLVIPDTVGRMAQNLEAGDTITASRRGSALENITAVAGDLSIEVKQVLQQTTRTLVKLQGTLANVDTNVNVLVPHVRTTVTSLASTMRRVDSLLAQVQENRLPDSITATLASTNRLVQRLDSLTTDAESMLAENHVAVNEAMANLTLASRQLNHFLEEAARRPYRLLTGVTPLPRDTLADSAKARPSGSQP
jgi:ABC-type transporter Mla subunit MlaD